MASTAGARFVLPVLAVVLATAVSTADARAQTATSPRLREGGLPARIPEAFGGGEVVLEVMVDASGAVTRVERLRLTPPYTEVLAQSAAAWRFEPATASINGGLTRRAPQSSWSPCSGPPRSTPAPHPASCRRCAAFHHRNFPTRIRWSCLRIHHTPLAMAWCWSKSR